MLSYPLSLFLDTNIFIGCRYDIGENGLLNKLKKLENDGRIRLYMNSVVYGELEKHLKSDVSIALRKLNKARKQVYEGISETILSNTPLVAINKLPCDGTIEQTAFINFKKYLEETNVIFLGNDGVDIDAILLDYFNGNAPFENKEVKKYEFPDAFIISRLKAEFHKNKPVWVISSDNGFRRALDNQEGFVCLSSINELLDAINKQDQMYDKIIQYIKNIDVQNEIIDNIKERIEDDGSIEVNGLDCDRKGNCVGYEYNDTFITNVNVESIEFSSVDEISDDIINLTISCKAKISASCTYYDYDNAFWDSEEKEYMFLSEVEIDEEHEPEFACSLTLEVNYGDNNVEFIISDISYDLVLDQYSRTERRFRYQDSRSNALENVMDTLEDYHNH